ncbi:MULTISPECIES: amidase [Streptosporangium]|uniref:Amidase n=1 Tax=Streptosporangium brasiliense TaxID=47480 RepID=A0ABT9QZ49_9ACTN|nr:amidase [Streptosporangium brasiliense]MDP9862244.1 amidase [Streptosporangium brasiliense]
MDPFDSASDLAEAVRKRELSPVEIVDTCLERINRYDPEVGAFVWRNDEQVRSAARRAEQAVMEGGRELPAFHGVPVPIKDLTQVVEQPATYGTFGVHDTPRTVTEPVVTRLLNAGFLLMGRTNSPDMGLLSTTDNSRYGSTRNPWNLAYSSGGSSGGAAAAVAAGLAPVAHANDGGGSIRMPSSCCGMVGLKPSRGRVPQYVASWEHATVEGAITRTVRDAAALLDVMSVPDNLVMYRAPAPERPFSDEVGRDCGSLRIGLLLDAPTGLPVDPVCAAAAMHTARLLESLGHAVFPVSPRFFSGEAIVGYTQTVLDAALWASPYDQPELAEPHLRYRMERAASCHSGTYTRAVALLQEESVVVRAQWGRDFDVLLTPTMACPPPLVDTVLAEANADPAGVRVTETQMISFTAVCNITGLPAITLPTYTSPDGLPIGSQLIGGPWDEAVLIRLAAALEELDRWPLRRPARFLG